MPRLVPDEAALLNCVRSLDPFTVVHVGTHSRRTQLRGRSKPFHATTSCYLAGQLRRGRLGAQLAAGRRPCNHCWGRKFAITAGREEEGAAGLPINTDAPTTKGPASASNDRTFVTCPHCGIEHSDATCPCQLEAVPA